MDIDCSIRECKKRKKEVKDMSLKELTHYNTKCCNCGEWLIKGNTKKSKIANDTNIAVSVKWAETMIINKLFD